MGMHFNWEMRNRVTGPFDCLRETFAAWFSQFASWQSQLLALCSDQRSCQPPLLGGLDLDLLRGQARRLQSYQLHRINTHPIRNKVRRINSFPLLHPRNSISEECEECAACEQENKI